MHTIRIDTTERSLPSCWDELSRSQLLFVSGMLLKGISVVDFKVAALFRFLSVGRKLFLRISPEEAWSLCRTLDFILTEITLSRNQIPTIRIGLRRYFGPSDGLQNCSFGEFTQAHTRFETYQSSKDLRSLAELAAILYRRKKLFWFVRRFFSESSDPRVSFSQRTVRRRARRFERLEPAILYAVLLFFCGCVNSLPARFPNVYRQKEDSVSSDTLSGWISLIISLADGRTDDKALDRVTRSNLYNVFMGLEYKSIEYFNYMEKISRK